MLKRFKDAGARADILAETIRIAAGRARWRRSTECPAVALRVGSVARRQAAGRRDEGPRPGADASNAAETVLWIVESGGCGGIYHAIDEQDLQRILRHPATMIASDGGVPVFGEASPHPRSYGTFSRVLGRYVRELKILSLEDAVRKMTRISGAATGPGRSRGPSRRAEGRHRGLRSRHRQRPCHVRAAAPVFGRRLACPRQRPGRLRKRRRDDCPSGSGPLRPWSGAQLIACSAFHRDRTVRTRVTGSRNRKRSRSKRHSY